MNKFSYLSFLVYVQFLFCGGCTLIEVSQKTKDGYSNSKSYLSDKSKKIYQTGKEKLGLNENKKTPPKAMTVEMKSFGKMPVE